MRLFVIAALLLAWAATAAQAQLGADQPGAYRQPFADRHKDTRSGPPPKIKADEKAYQDALKRVPDQPKTNDPWQGTR